MPAAPENASVHLLTEEVPAVPADPRVRSTLCSTNRPVAVVAPRSAPPLGTSLVAAYPRRVIPLFRFLGR